ncbi:MAG: hypothetical protein GY828_00110 [Candidatus Gracilibacteria bacterium]|nr:hypothetical protein [Candidatus Gracilibacteria bacterium]
MNSVHNGSKNKTCNLEGENDQFLETKEKISVEIQEYQDVIIQKVNDKLKNDSLEILIDLLHQVGFDTEKDINTEGLRNYLNDEGIQKIKTIATFLQFKQSLEQYSLSDFNDKSAQYNSVYNNRVNKINSNNSISQEIKEEKINKLDIDLTEALRKNDLKRSNLQTNKEDVGKRLEELTYSTFISEYFNPETNTFSDNNKSIHYINEIAIKVKKEISHTDFNFDFYDEKEKIVKPEREKKIIEKSEIQKKPFDWSALGKKLGYSGLGIGLFALMVAVNNKTYEGNSKEKSDIFFTKTEKNLNTLSYDEVGKLVEKNINEALSGQNTEKWTAMDYADYIAYNTENKLRARYVQFTNVTVVRKSNGLLYSYVYKGSPSEVFFEHDIYKYEKEINSKYSDEIHGKILDDKEKLSRLGSYTKFSTEIKKELIKGYGEYGMRNMDFIFDITEDYITVNYVIGGENIIRYYYLTSSDLGINTNINSQIDDWMKDIMYFSDFDKKVNDRMSYAIFVKDILSTHYNDIGTSFYGSKINVLGNKIELSYKYNGDIFKKDYQIPEVFHNKGETDFELRLESRKDKIVKINQLIKNVFTNAINDYKINSEEDAGILNGQLVMNLMGGGFPSHTITHEVVNGYFLRSMDKKGWDLVSPNLPITLDSKFMLFTFEYSVDGKEESYSRFYQIKE